MPTAEQWRLYYEYNAQNLMEVPWHLNAELTLLEIRTIGQSLREFQAGEGSEGKHLIRYAKAYSETTGDLEYIAAIRLFIAEEQRHARDLGRFLTLNGIPLVKTTFTDRVFRSLRHVFGGLEMSVAVLITAEIIAKVYYAVLRETTRSAILRALCDQILQDEVRHVEFQAEQLGKLRLCRGRLGRAATMSAQRILYAGTVIIVWMFHRRVIRAAKVSFGKWWKWCWKEFQAAFGSEAPNNRRIEPLGARGRDGAPSDKSIRG